MSTLLERDFPKRVNVQKMWELTSPSGRNDLLKRIENIYGPGSQPSWAIEPQERLHISQTDDFNSLSASVKEHLTGAATQDGWSIEKCKKWVNETGC